LLGSDGGGQGGESRAREIGTAAVGIAQVGFCTARNRSVAGLGAFLGHFRRAKAVRKSAILTIPTSKRGFRVKNYRLALRLVLGGILRPRGKNALLKRLDPHCSVLDVGCGNNSPYWVKSLFPSMHYTGVDVGDYGQTKPVLADRYATCKPEEFSAEIAKFKNCFDAVISSHNIEHCIEPEKTLEAMLDAVRPGGRLFMAFPAEESRHFPKRLGTLNYYDDETHQTNPPSFDQIISTVKQHGFEIEYKSSRYRPPILWMLGLVVEPISAIRKKVCLGTWELYGFVSIVWARKNSASPIAIGNLKT
jgi:SAM-dependent methyltransferase